MKKLVSIILALVFVLCLTTSAFAYTDAEKASLVNSKTIAVRNMYDSQGYKYDYSSERNRFKATFTTSSEAMGNCTVWTFVQYDLVEFNADYQVNCPESRRSDVAVFFMRINERFRIGQFYMSWDDGLMGYKVLCYTEENDPSQECLYWGLRLCVEEVGAVGDVLNLLLNGSLTVDQAVSSVMNG